MRDELMVIPEYRMVMKEMGLDQIP
jgi:hypothetical protein